MIHSRVKSGKMIKPDRCALCGKKPRKQKIQAHHPNYDEPLYILWLCESCHRMFHSYSTENHIAEIWTKKDGMHYYVNKKIWEEQQNKGGK